MTISIEEWEQRKAFVGFGETEAQLLSELKELVVDHTDEIIDKLYANWSDFKELRELLKGQDTIQRLKSTQKDYFNRLLSGEYGQSYLEDRIRVGIRHQRIGLDVRWYMGAFCNYIDAVTPHIFRLLASDPEKAQKTILALYKLINLDEEVAITSYIDAREDVIAKQHEEILELSTPVVQLWEGVVAAPIIGTLDSHRTQLFMERLLESIVETRSPVALVDITGVSAIDTATAQHLIDTINAVKLLGAEVIITGVSPSIAQTLVHLGIDLSGIYTRSSLADGLKQALEMLNKSVSH